MKKTLLLILTLTLIMSCFVGCGKEKTNIDEQYPEAKRIVLDGAKATIDGTAVEKFDYTWHCDPSVSHDEVKNAPAEYYTGTKGETDAAVYIDNDLKYYPKLDESGFKLQEYDGEKEWVYHYTDGEHNDFIFSTLPALTKSIPTQMMHTPEEALKNKVLHITEAGSYIISGKWDGQILVDLGDEDETFSNPDATVTLILDNADVTCTVAPAIVFKSAYECDNKWEEREEYSAETDLSKTGANVILAEGSENNINGKNIFRMLKTVYKDEETTVQKKQRKIDSAFYSFVSMNISGEGALNIDSGFEGLDSELHLAINGGNITINSQDDGINVNEDNVSVVSINGGNITLNAALGAEGDGIDSNGYISINGGTLNINGITAPDSAMDSEKGIYYNSGKVIIDGKEQSYTKGSVFNETGRGGMGGGQNFGQRPNMQINTNFDIKKFKEEVADLPDDATFEDVLKLLGMDMGRGERPGDMGEPPENMMQEGMPSPPQNPNL